MTPFSQRSAKRTPSMPPPGMKKPTVAIDIEAKKPTMPKDPEDPEEAGEKMAPEKAIVIRANEHCKDCENYTPESGECSKVEGSFEPEDSCWGNFMAMGGDDEAAEGEEMPEEAMMGMK